MLLFPGNVEGKEIPVGWLSGAKTNFEYSMILFKGSRRRVTNAMVFEHSEANSSSEIAWYTLQGSRPATITDHMDQENREKGIPRIRLQNPCQHHFPSGTGLMIDPFYTVIRWSSLLALISWTCWLCLSCDVVRYNVRVVPEENQGLNVVFCNQYIPSFWYTNSLGWVVRCSRNEKSPGIRGEQTRRVHLVSVTNNRSVITSLRRQAQERTPNHTWSHPPSSILPTFLQVNKLTELVLAL